VIVPHTMYPSVINDYCHNTAIPIMTDANIPDDVVAIISVEQAAPATFVEVGDSVLLPSVYVGRIIRRAGSDMQTGARLASKGSVIDAALVATAASQAIAELPVRARPRIGGIAG